MKCLLNVGGGSKVHPIPPYYAGWRHDLLDIDPRGGADIVMDARELLTLTPAKYDAVFCGHNLEHYHRHEGAKVLRGFLHVLKRDGFAEIRVPDLQFLFEEVVKRNLGIDDVFYVSPSGPILVRDVLYGYHVEIEKTGQDFYGHKTGFTKKSLSDFVMAQGFAHFIVGNSQPQEIVGFFFRETPNNRLLQMLGLRVTT